MLTYFGDLGGLLDFVLGFGWLISTVFVSRLFQAALVKKAYRVQRYMLDTTEYYETGKPGALTTESESKSDESENVLAIENEESKANNNNNNLLEVTADPKSLNRGLTRAATGRRGSH